MKSSKKVVISLWLLVSVANFARGNDDCLEEDPGDLFDSSFDLTPHLGHISGFSLDLLREILNNERNEANTFLSPYSIWNALALSYLGSGGETEKQLQTVLKTSGKVDTLKQWRAVDYVYVMRQLQSKDYRFGLANKAYFDKRFQLQICIQQVLSSELQRIDFSKPQNASEIINNFIGDATEGHIRKVTKASDLEDVQLALVNAAFFKDKWRTPFKKSNTRRERFYPFSGEEQFVDMMRHRGPFKHGISEALRSHILEIPYSMKDISMFLFLPPSLEGKNGLEHLLTNLNEETLEEAVSQVWFDNLDVYVPKMTITSSFDSELKRSLQNMGIRDLFKEEAANLTNFVPKGGVHVSRVMHQSYLEVSEEGTEAASATVVLGRGRSARPSSLRSFICDHPFVFLIYDKLTKNILFLGVFTNVT